MGDTIRTTLTVLQPDDTATVQVIDLPADPSLADIKAVVLPLIDGADLEHVAVLHKKRRLDMFVDETGALKPLPRNEIATTIYRANWLKQHPDADPELLDAIYGPAVLFERIVWR